MICAVCGTDVQPGSYGHRNDPTHWRVLVPRRMRAAGFELLKASGGEQGTTNVTVGYLNRVCVAAGITPRKRHGVAHGRSELWVPAWVVPLLTTGLAAGQRITAQEANARSRLLHYAAHDRELRAAWTALATMLEPTGVLAWIEREGHLRYNRAQERIPEHLQVAAMHTKGKPMNQRGFRIGERID